MSQRLVVAALLVTSICGLHAQDSQAQKSRITSTLNKCGVGQAAGSQSSARGCIGNDWFGHLQDETQRAGQQAEQKFTGERRNFQQTIEKLSGELGKSQNEYAKLQRDYNALVKGMPDVKAAILADRGERRENAKAALKQFLETFEANSKALGLSFQFVSASPLAGTVLIQRQGASAILLPLPSLASAYLQETDTEPKDLRLYFDCAVGSADCMSLVSKDGGLTKSGRVWFLVSRPDAAKLAQQADVAIQAFK